MPQLLKLRERIHIESFRNLGRDMIFGVVKIDPAKCKGCNYCARICPANALEIKDKLARMTTAVPMCMSCGGCAAICPEGAIIQERYIGFNLAFRYLDRGEPQWPRAF